MVGRSLGKVSREYRLFGNSWDDLLLVATLVGSLDLKGQGADLPCVGISDNNQEPLLAAK